MKKTFIRVKQYWTNLMHSTQNKISRGAANIFKTITFARGENWRRKNDKK